MLHLIQLHERMNGTCTQIRTHRKRERWTHALTVWQTDKHWRHGCLCTVLTIRIRCVSVYDLEKYIYVFLCVHKPLAIDYVNRNGQKSSLIDEYSCDRILRNVLFIFANPFDTCLRWLSSNLVITHSSLVYVLQIGLLRDSNSLVEYHAVRFASFSDTECNTLHIATIW